MSEERFKLSKYVTPSSVSNFCDENGENVVLVDKKEFKKEKKGFNRL